METVAVEDLVAVVGFRLSQQLRIGRGFQDDETYKQSKKKEVMLGRLNLKRTFLVFYVPECCCVLLLCVVVCCWVLLCVVVCCCVLLRVRGVGRSPCSYVV
jgi:hypothetical protein